MWHKNNPDWWYLPVNSAVSTWAAIYPRGNRWMVSQGDADPLAEGFADSPEDAQAAAEKALVDLGYKFTP